MTEEEAAGGAAAAQDVAAAEGPKDEEPNKQQPKDREPNKPQPSNRFCPTGENVPTMTTISARQQFSEC